MSNKQKTAAEIRRAMPANPADKGPVVLSAATAQRAVEALGGNGPSEMAQSVEQALKL